MRDELKKKIAESVKESQYDAVVVFGADNVQYMSGAYLHFPPTFPDRYMAVFWAKGEEPICIVPPEWESSFLHMAWVSKTKTYTEKPGSPTGVAEAVANLARNTVRKTGKIGVDAERTALNLYRRLEAALEDFTLVPCDGWLRELRVKKTPKELRLLETVASMTDHAIAGQAHHILVKQTATEMSNTENVRIHAIERGLDEVGHHAVAQVTAGPNTGKFWPGAPMYGIGFDRVPQHREFMRLELTATLDGYWSNGARMLTMGEPTEEQKAAYQSLVALREVALQHMKPGARCKDVYTAVKQAADEKGIQLVSNLVIGAGVGVTNNEPPYISGADETELQPGMVIVLNPVVEAPGGELLMGEDTVFITENGAKVVGWFKDWREPFICNYTY
ncbi:MAG TPA: M24 family metallopeptidase [Candidatus Krumholzibacteriaceae bacterium]|nr:M24 family metallopeptidase [Candidatus Krumholzibacteriaceae bacterium]